MKVGVGMVRWERSGGAGWALGLMALGLMVWTGCAPCQSSFEEVQVHGGEAETRAQVFEALADFSGWTGRDTICVDQVEVITAWDESGERKSLGRYRSRTRTIHVLEGQPHIYDTVIHELCHAVDHEDGITRRHKDAFVYDPEAFDHDDRTKRSRRREAMAFACEAGPDALAIAREVAPVCAPEIDVEFASILLDEVYQAVDPELPPGPALQEEELASWALPEGWSLVGARPIYGGGQGELRAQVEVPGGYGIARIDGFSGDFLGFVDSSNHEIRPTTHRPEGWTYLWERFTSAGWSGEARLATFQWRLSNGEEIRPMVLHEGGRWRSVEQPCAPEQGWIVQGPGTPWMVEQDGQRLSWSAWRRSG